MRRGVFTLGIVAILVSSCGERGLPAGVATSLQDQVALIRQAAEAGRPGYARSRLDALVEIVTSRLNRGVIDEERALEILDSSEAVRDQLSLLPRLSPTEAPSPSPTQAEEGGGGGKDKGHGDEGHGKDD